MLPYIHMSTGGTHNPQTIRIDSSTIVRTILFVLLFVALYLLRDLVLVILTAVVIASAIEPAARRLESWRIPRVPAVILIYAMVAGVLAGIFYFFLPPLLEDVSNIVARAPEFYNSLQLEGLLGDLGGTAQASQFTLSDVLARIQQAVSGDSGGVFGTLSKIFGGVLSFVLIITISFYLAVQKNGISSFLRLVTPVQYEKYIIDLWQRSQRKIGRWLQGQIILMLIVGVLTYLGLTILGIRNALLLGIIAAFFEIIPLFGPILSAIPAIAIGLLDGGLTLGLMVAGLFVIIQQFENNLIHPLVVTKVVGVSPIIVIVALVVGGTLAGFLGVLLAVPMAAAIMEYAHDVERKKYATVDAEAGGEEASPPID